MPNLWSLYRSQDGTGDYRTVQEAIDAVPLCNTCHTVVRVSPGIYKQPVYVPETKILITLAGLRPFMTQKEAKAALSAWLISSVGRLS
ncbi:hypothetical protein LguiB_013631 [Lonicera macranthoides]